MASSFGPIVTTMPATGNQPMAPSPGVADSDAIVGMPSTTAGSSTAPTVEPTVAAIPAAGNQPAPLHTEIRRQMKPALTSLADTQPARRGMRFSKGAAIKLRAGTASLYRKNFELFRTVCHLGGADQREPRVLWVFAWSAIKGGAGTISSCPKRFKFIPTVHRLGGADQCEPRVLWVFAWILNAHGRSPPQSNAT